MSRAEGTTGSFAEPTDELSVEQALLLDGACNAFEAAFFSRTVRPRES